jgi:hypothetical protein
MQAMSVDADTAGNAATVLGPHTPCIAATAGSSVNVDITATGVPPYSDNGTPGDFLDDTGGIISHSYTLLYDETQLTVEAQAINFLLASNTESSLFNAGDVVPDIDNTGTFNGAVLDSGASIPESGSGVLERLTIAVLPTTPSGLYTLVIDPGNSVHLDASGAAYPPLAINDATLAVGVACP